MVDAPPEKTPTQGRVDGTSSGEGSGGDPAGQPSGPGQSDAGPAPAPTCGAGKKAAGEVCASTDACCGGCNEDGRCADSCRSFGSSCDPTQPAPCCLGFYCGLGFCSPCKRSGEKADDVLGQRIARSCCSKEIGDEGRCR